VSGTGGAILATDEISLVHFQISKLAWGALGTANLVSTTDPIPVDLRSDNLGGNLDVAVASVPAPLNVVGSGTEATAQRVTLATDSTGVLSVDDNGGSLTMDNATLAVVGGGAEATALRVTIATDSTGVLSIDDNGGSLTVDGVLTSLGSITTSVVPGVAATNLGKAIDSAQGATDTGVALLAVRDDALSALTPVDGDYVPARTNSTGALWVIPSGTVVVDGSGVTQPISGTVTVGSLPASTNTIEVVGDAAHDAVAAGNPVLQGAYASAAAPSDVSGDADVVRLWSLRNGSQVVNLAAGGTLITGDGSNGLDVDVTRIQGTVTVAAHAVTNAGTFATQVDGAALTALQLIDDPVIADDAAFTPGTSKVMMAGAQFDDTGPDSVDEGDAGALRMSANRNLYIQIRDLTAERSAAVTAANALTVDGSAVTQPVSNTVLNVVGGGAQATAQRVTLANDSTGVLASVGSITTAIVPGVAATNLGKAIDAVAGATDTAVGALAVRRDADTSLVGTTGDWAPLLVDANGYLKVEIFDGGGSHTVDGTITANAGTGTFISGGDLAHDAVDSGNPVKFGAQARQTWQAAVADADRANVVCDDLGRLITVPHGPRDLVVQNRIVLTTTSETTLLAQVASHFLDLTSLEITNESSTEVRVDLRDTTGGSVVWSIDLASDGGGISKSWPVPFKQTTINTNWTAQLSAGVSSVYLTVQAIKNV